MVSAGDWNVNPSDFADAVATLKPTLTAIPDLEAF
jgi:hypothetical protein